MLNVWYKGGNVTVLTNAPLYFDGVFEPEWFDYPLVKEMVKDVDDSEVVGPYLIISPVLGPIAPTHLSGGVKVLILLLKDPNFIYNISNCGDNCAKWILKIAEEKALIQHEDLVVYLEHIMRFENNFCIKILNTGKEVRTMQDYVLELFKAEAMVTSGKLPEAIFD